MQCFIYLKKTIIILVLLLVAEFSLASEVCPQLLKSDLTPAEIQTIDLQIERLKTQTIEVDISQFSPLAQRRAEAHIAYLKQTGSHLLSGYFEVHDKSSFIFPGGIANIMTVPDVQLEAFYDDVVRYLRHYRDYILVIKGERELTEEEAIFLEVISSMFKFLKDSNAWFLVKARAASSLLKYHETLTVDSYIYSLMLDFITEHGDRLISEELAAGKVKYVKDSPRIKKIKEFLKDRALKKYVGNIIWWGPIFLYLKFQEEVSHFLGLLQ